MSTRLGWGGLTATNGARNFAGKEVAVPAGLFEGEGRYAPTYIGDGRFAVRRTGEGRYAPRHDGSGRHG